MPIADDDTSDGPRDAGNTAPAARANIAPFAQPPVPAAAQLPVVVHHERPTRRRWLRFALLLVVLAGAAAGGGWWWLHRVPPLPAGIAFGNGRLEADPIDIATKFAGRIAELKVDEGSMVKAGEVVALMDTRDLEALLKKAEAQVEQASKAIAEANANVSQGHTQVVLAQQQYERAQQLLKNGWTSREVMDQRRQQLEGAQASELAAQAHVRAAEAILNAATHDVELYKVNIADNTLVAPKDGRIEYRIANVGEVLPAGGKVFTMLDVGYVYMDIYLPTAIAGHVKVGNDARIVLDAYPDRPIPAKVTFIAAQAQFTPKMVETQTERDKLMFRIRVRIDPGLSQAHADAVRSGVPGMAYVKFDPAVEWPDRLQGRS
ncbi:MAG: HlyD family efflux transporter periplasmic adaptor subunit [Alphaproteobacteria bacterium]|nr:HlyD family efflux transporter periplasmic adaptor subunit [Alphaproteobacteria bacterium]